MKKSRMNLIRRAAGVLAAALLLTGAAPVPGAFAATLNSSQSIQETEALISPSGVSGTNGSTAAQSAESVPSISSASGMPGSVTTSSIQNAVVGNAASSSQGQVSQGSAQGSAQSAAGASAGTVSATVAAVRNGENVSRDAQVFGEAVQAGIDQSSYLGGAEILFITSQTDVMESFLITTRNGKHILIDGGNEGDAQHLKDVILSKGGHIDCWLITHPHSDHVAAMTQLIKSGDSGITFGSIYYHFASMDWYWGNEAYRAQMVQDCMDALGTLDPSIQHADIRKGDVINVDDVKITVMNDPYFCSVNAINNSSVAFRFEINGKRILFLGDMGLQAGQNFMELYAQDRDELRADIVQMAHHGENGVDRNVYEAIRPSVCIWCAPEWLWDNNNGEGVNRGKWKTIEVRGWMRDLGVKRHYVAKDGDQVIR